MRDSTAKDLLGTSIINRSSPEAVLDVWAYFSDSEIKRAVQRKAFHINATRAREELRRRGVSLKTLSLDLGYSESYFYTVLGEHSLSKGNTRIPQLRKLMARLELEEEPDMGKPLFRRPDIARKNKEDKQ